ncbi:hypothetical protein CIB95_07690 [Lottiidibacillus patelloidae]|uniref:DUF1761 domain-containing protein n=1 Tax=Lottiidibacillus patelloidae TaxID=2670334 RepID=A0A263BUG8_9BACI|nr:DUF1761 domain-containing protein [Lottiidibacillus patelloidae]OZM57335.1 hypothetical protein CIB95_07690 [Lottiidibacillus patelloidae]
MLDFEISILAIILAVISNGVIGALWYSPLLFGNRWISAMGKKKEDFDKSGANIGYMLTMIAAIITALTLTFFINMMEVVTIGGGALIGFLAGLGIAAMRELSPTFFEGRNITLYLISISYHIFSLTVMGMIIAYFY